ncbi:Pentatricopeptide repeat-containing protein At1g74630 [Linum grandiflorum]
MVDLYSRAGQLEKAYQFACQMPIPPNAIIWRTLLGACSFHGDVKLAEQVKLKLAELDPKDSGDHILLSNIYAVADEEKEDSISSHSEKLAVAFGIGRLCRGKMIRIVKNLRICKDCHVLMKLISQVYDVEIVVRDRSRFHTFKSGSCSCRDYW